MPEPASEEILVATLGVAPQVVTLALDELLQRGHAIHRVVVLHTSAQTPVIERSLRRLREEAPLYATRRPSIAWEWVPIVDEDGVIIADTNDECGAHAVFRACIARFWRAKRPARAFICRLRAGAK